MHDIKNFNCLLPKTRALLTTLVESCDFLHNYTLVGGSALALHLCHRQSEDLDFFTYGEGFDKKEIFAYLDRFEDKRIIHQNDTQIDALIDGVKVTFFDARWDFLRPQVPMTFNLASLASIAAMKVNTLFLRATYRDYYDLYRLAKEGMGLREMFGYSTKIVEGIDFKLFAVALLYIDDIEDDEIAHLQPIETISKEAIRDFFQARLQDMTMH